MHILYVHQYFSTRDGAFGTRSYEFARHLVRSGHQVTMVFGLYGDQGRDARLTSLESLDGIRLSPVRVASSNQDGVFRRGVAFLRFALGSSWKALRLKYDLVYATSTPLTVAFPGLAAKWFRRKPFVFEVRDLWPELPRAMGVIRNRFVLWALDRLETTAYRHADLCVGLAPGIVQGIEEKRKKQDVLLIPNACDTDLFAPATPGLASVPGIQPGDTVALFCGAHGKANGLWALLDAAEELLKRNESNIKLLLVGEGSEKAALRASAKQRGLRSLVFLDPVPKRELAILMPRCHAGLMILADVPAFRQGTSPNKFFDYLASGLPVICNYPGWMADLIHTHACGWSLPPGDATAMADSLQSLRNAPANARTMGQNARKLGEEAFNRQNLAETLQDSLESLWSRHRP